MAHIRNVQENRPLGISMLEVGMQVASISFFFLTITVLYFLVSFGHGLDNVLAADSSFVTDDQVQVSDATGTPNPAAVYCQGLGYKYHAGDGSNGQYGIVIVPDGAECKTWDFLQGKCGQEYSYCAKCGYGIEDHQRREKSTFTGICCVC
jgi:putative hemolysin